jgi:hypothetical protein
VCCVGVRRLDLHHRGQKRATSGHHAAMVGSDRCVRCHRDVAPIYVASAGGDVRCWLCQRCVSVVGDRYAHGGAVFGDRIACE